MIGTDDSVFDTAEESDFRQVIAANLGVDSLLIAGIDYHNLAYPDNLQRFQTLFGQLQISLAQFNQAFQTKFSFYPLHLTRWEKLAAAEKLHLNAAYWLECSERSQSVQEHFISGIATLERNLAEPRAERYRDDITPDYLGLLEAEITARFPRGTEIPDYQSTYRDNLRTLPADNFEVNSWGPIDRSLLYFTLSETDIIRLREKLQAQRPVPVSADPEPQGDEETDPEVTDMEKAAAGADRTPPGQGAARNGHGVGKGGGGFGSGGDADKRAFGLRAEKMVLKTLKGKTWQWMSGYSNDPSKNDQAGYDIRYKEPDDPDWTYIEVKWFERGIFRLPDTEFNFAKFNADRYYIYLVTPDRIRKVLFRELVDEDGEFVRQNDYFAYAVSEYKFRQL